MDPSPSDEELMRRLSQGQMSCAADLFERYHVKLFNFFLRLTADRAASEDLTQTVFERLIRYRQSYVEGMAFRSWIYQIARNARVDHARQNRPNAAGLAPGWDPGDSEAPVSQRLEEREERQRLHQAMARLGDDQRELLVLTRFQHMKYREVANLMNTTEGAIKIRVHRAIRDLRDIFLKMNAR